jgi:type I restriction enzyme R subunit
VLPKLVDAGWDNEPHRINEQITFTDGRIVLAGNKVRRRPQKRADYLLRYQKTKRTVRFANAVTIQIRN